MKGSKDVDVGCTRAGAFITVQSRKGCAQSFKKRPGLWRGRRGAGAALGMGRSAGPWGTSLGVDGPLETPWEARGSR